MKTLVGYTRVYKSKKANDSYPPGTIFLEMLHPDEKCGPHPDDEYWKFIGVCKVTVEVPAKTIIRKKKK